MSADRESLHSSRPPRWTAFSGAHPIAHGDTRSEAAVRAKPRLYRGQRVTLYVLRERDYPFAVVRTEAP